MRIETYEKLLEPVDYSIIIPAYNEEDYLSHTLVHLEQAMQTIDLKGEVIVVDNNSTDKTAAIARKHGTRIVFEPINQISRARNAGAKVALGRYIIFLDADTEVSAELLQLALISLQGGQYCGGGVKVAADTPLYPLAQKTLDFWNWISRKLNLAAGCFIFCLREAFEGCGGFSEHVYASEEIWLSRRIAAWGKQRGLRFRIITEYPITTSMRKLSWYSQTQLVIASLTILICPFVLRSRSLCGLWYRRPGS